ncbi:hypothetical protein FOA43_002807 [Brettanomyces nanus]|uniref:Uncharacterized protein n=1 Tax=Eeniella nana TaxID=13502 RepID=A0A875S617_EENNA|nr:uncharacterized protein FOA43_002807 [Brettanomyces nanus]QPG75452.1 hypothetical protein FOA43_002807 [Brettanomyces nanus]
MDDSSISLGINKLSEASVSPLGQNSVYELVENTNYRHRATATGLLTIGSSSASVNVKGPSIKDIPATSLTKIKKVKDQQFGPYLNTIADAYKEFHSHKTLTESTLEAFMTQLSNEERKKEKARRKTANASVNTDYGLTEEEEAQMDSNSLEQVSSVYFSDDFRLDDPRVFNEVVGNAIILEDTVDFNEDGQQKPLINNEEVQDKLSSYLDIVEIHLIHEISKSSGSFFSALGDLKNITKQSDSLTNQLHNVDSKLESLDKDRAHVAIQMLKLTQKRNNVEKLEQALLQISTILQQADLAESSYFNANYEKALQLTEAVFSLINGNNPKNQIVDKITCRWPYPLFDLSAVPALTSLKRLLGNLTTDTGKSLARLFGDFLLEDLRSHYENASRAEVMDRLASNLSKNNRLNRKSLQPPGYQVVTDEFKQQIHKYISEMSRCGELASAYKLYEERFLAELKTIIKSFLPTDILENIGQPETSISGRSDETRSTTTQRSGMGGLSKNVRAMTPKEFEDMLVGIYTQLSEGFRRLITQKKLLLEMGLDCLAEYDSRYMDEQPDVILQLDITNAITAAINVTQRRMAKLINVREVQNSCVTLDYFLRLYSVNVMFLMECELISGGRIASPVLQDIINIQFQKFTVQYHRASLKILSGKIEKETWRECLLPSSLQKLTNQIAEAAKDGFDESVWMNPMNLELRPAKPREEAEEENDDKNIDPTQRKTLMIGDKSYIVPEIVSTVLRMVQSYEIIKMQFPKVDNGNIIELFKLANLKIHQSVLGAQATRTAGLRNITSKHLAVTSQLLGFLSALIPSVIAAFDRLSKVGSFVETEFKKVQQMFSDQQTEIFEKLVSIMVDRVRAQSSEIRSTDWSTPLPRQQVHHYMESLVSKTLTIARILLRYLPESQYTLILSKIFGQYKRVLTDIYSQVKLKDSVDKAVMMRDVDYFREKLADVAGYGNSGQIIWENINALETEEDSRTQQPQQVSLPEEKPLPKKPEAAKPEAATPEAANPGAAEPESAKPEAEKAESAKPEAAIPESEKPESEKPEAAEPEAAKVIVTPSISDQRDREPEKQIGKSSDSGERVEGADKEEMEKSDGEWKRDAKCEANTEEVDKPIEEKDEEVKKGDAVEKVGENIEEKDIKENAEEVEEEATTDVEVEKKVNKEKIEPKESKSMSLEGTTTKTSLQDVSPKDIGREEPYNSTEKSENGANTPTKEVGLKALKEPENGNGKEEVDNSKKTEYLGAETGEKIYESVRGSSTEKSQEPAKSDKTESTETQILKPVETAAMTTNTSSNQRKTKKDRRRKKLEEGEGIGYVKALKQAIMGPDEMAQFNSIIVLAKMMDYLPKSDHIFSLFDSKLFACLLDASCRPSAANEAIRAVLRICLIFLWGVLPETKPSNMYDPLLWNVCNNHSFFENLSSKLSEQDLRLALASVDFVSQLLYRTYDLKNPDIILSEIRCLMDSHFFDSISMLPYEFKSRLDSFSALRKSSKLILKYLSTAPLRNDPFSGLVNECILVIDRILNECGSGQKFNGRRNSTDYSKVGLLETVDPQHYIQQNFSSAAVIDLIYVLRNPNMTFKKNFSEHTMFATAKTYFPLLKFAVGITNLLNHLDSSRYPNIAYVFTYFNDELYYSFMSSALKFWMASKAEENDFRRIMALLETLVDYCDSLMRSDPFYTVTEQVVGLKYSEIKKYHLEQLKRNKATSWSTAMESFNRTIGQQVLDFVKTQRFVGLSKGSWVYINNPLDKAPVSGKPVYYFLVLSSNNKSLIYKEFTRKHSHAPNIDKDGIIVDFKNVVKIDSKSMTQQVQIQNLINIASRLNVSRIDICTKDEKVFSFYVDSLGLLYAWLDGVKMLLNDNSALSEDTMYQIDALTKIRTNVQLIDLEDSEEKVDNDSVHSRNAETKYDATQLEILASHFYYE